MKIDYVVPMVFPEDPLWQEDFKKYAFEYVESTSLWSSWNTGRELIEFVKKYFPWVRYIYTIVRKNTRFLWQNKARRCFEKSPNKYTDTYTLWRSWGTEKHLIQLVKKNLPWLRNIYVILARESQRQDWMNDEKVKVVYHKDFIPQKYLPTFSSNTIEMFLHKIPGLSEFFIYGNDDMFPLTPMEETDFFEDGKPCQHMEEVDWPSNPNTFQKRCMRGQSYVACLFGKEKLEKWLKNGHSLAPIRKTTCEEFWEKGEKDIEASISILRSEKSFSQYVYPWWQHYSGDYIDKTFPKRFIKSSDCTPEQLSTIITETEGVLCINDFGGTEDYKSLAMATCKALELIIKK